VGMVDPWELLDRAMNVEGLITAIFDGGVAIYLIYRNRERLKQIAAKTARTLKVLEPPPDVVVQMKPANVRVHALRLKAQSKGGESLSALDKFLDWYLRIATS
jgi:hypothetical protein